MQAHLDGHRDGSFLGAAIPDQLREGANPWANCELDASACVRPDAAGDVYPEPRFPGEDVEK